MLRVLPEGSSMRPDFISIRIIWTTLSKVKVQTPFDNQWVPRGRMADGRKGRLTLKIHKYIYTHTENLKCHDMYNLNFQTSDLKRQHPASQPPAQKQICLQLSG